MVSILNEKGGGGEKLGANGTKMEKLERTGLHWKKKEPRIFKDENKREKKKKKNPPPPR